MWILKGAFPGRWLFALGTLVLFCLAVFHNPRAITAVGLSVFAGQTTWHPFWWAALPVAIVAGCLLARSWPGKRWFGISLMVTFLFPAGCWD